MAMRNSQNGPLLIWALGALAVLIGVPSAVMTLRAVVTWSDPIPAMRSRGIEKSEAYSNISQQPPTSEASCHLVTHKSGFKSQAIFVCDPNNNIRYRFSNDPFGEIGVPRTQRGAG